MRRLHSLILLSAFYTLLLVLSLFIPVWMPIVAGIAVTTIVVLRKRTEHRMRVENIQHRLSNLRGEGLLIEGKVKGTEEDVFYRMILTLLADLERSLFKLVEKNIQLLSLKEIGRNIISSLDEQKVINSVFDYLVRGVGYKETAFILLRKKKGCFQAVVGIERATRVIRRVVNFDFSDLRGAAYNAFISGKPYLIKDITMHPLFTTAGEPLFPGSTMTSYLVVPLMKSSEELRCFESDDCLIKRLVRGESESADLGYLKQDVCMVCPSMPLLGALIITDGYRAAPLTNIDQVTLETVGSLVSSNIENWLLYQELRQEEIFRENVIEGMLNGVFVVDLEGDVTLANRSARYLGAFDPEEVTGTSIRSLIVWDSQDGGEHPVLRVLKHKKPLVFFETHLKCRDGKHIPIRMNVSPLVGEDNEIQGGIIEFVDLSDIKRMEEEIRHLDRLAVLGRFTSAVAHEIRNPLTGIAAGIQYLNRDEHLSDEHRENISFILNEVDRLNRIIVDLLKVARPHNILYQKVRLGDLVDRGYQSVGEIYRNKSIDFRRHIDDNLPEIEVDFDQIVQVLINLLKNAAEAVGEEGVVSIGLQIYEGGDAEVAWEKERDMICIEIRDNGSGIEPKDRESIFEPFYSKKKGGTGLGLFVTHSIIQHHQGRITIDSNEGEGTTFRVYLPITRPGKGE